MIQIHSEKVKVKIPSPWQQAILRQHKKHPAYRAAVAAINRLVAEIDAVTEGNGFTDQEPKAYIGWDDQRGEVVITVRGSRFCYTNNDNYEQQYDAITSLKESFIEVDLDITAMIVKTYEEKGLFKAKAVLNWYVKLKQEEIDLLTDMGVIREEYETEKRRIVSCQV